MSTPLVPRTNDLRVVAEAARTCTACPLYREATQTVFGEGPVPAELFVVGEQPGDSEDLAGRPFTGPAGKLLDEILASVGIARRAIYVTNAVKHFKFQRRGKRRIHDKPSLMEVRACHGWLEAELRIVRPRIVACLGATAAQAFLGGSFRLTQHLGEVRTDTPFAPYWMATYHPSALLRMPDEALRRRARAQFAASLAQLVPLLRGSRSRESDAAARL